MNWGTGRWSRIVTRSISQPCLNVVPQCATDYGVSGTVRVEIPAETAFFFYRPRADYRLLGISIT